MGIALCEGYVVVCEKLSVYGEASPDNVVNVWVIDGVFNEAFNALALSFISIAASLDAFGKIFPYFGLVGLHKVSINVGFCFKIDVKRTNSRACTLTDIGYGRAVESLGCEELLRGGEQLIHFRLSKLGLRDVNSLDVKATVFHFLHFPPFVYKLSYCPSVSEFKKTIVNYTILDAVLQEFCAKKLNENIDYLMMFLSQKIKSGIAPLKNEAIPLDYK